MLERHPMGTRQRSKLLVLGLVLTCVGGCPPTSESEEGGETTPVDDDPSTCEAAPACPGMPAEGTWTGGWARGGGDSNMTIFLSNPATACGDKEPGNCTNCGNYESIELTLPGAAQAPGTYDGTDVTMVCGSWISDCMGNGGGEGEPDEGFTLEITSIDDTCVVGEVVMTSTCSAYIGSFAVSRCP